MSSEFAIKANDLGKCYGLYARPIDRLKQLLLKNKQREAKVFWALSDINLLVRPGEVVGLVGRNGAGKSTLLQMLCGTLPPSTGQLQVNGRIAALLELGAGFNPEFTGVENVFMNGAILGMKRQEVAKKLDEILKKQFPEVEKNLEERKQNIVESFPHLARYVKKINSLTMTESNILKFAENEFFKETKKVRGEVEKFTNELKKGKTNFSEKRFNDIMTV